MIKRLIFDMDNTLLIWKEKYKEAIRKTIAHYNLDIDYLLADKVIDSYEGLYDKYVKKDMVELINKNFNLTLDVDFIDYFLKELAKMGDIDEELISLLEYLSKKYELVVLTNWFKECQEGRLTTAKIRKYFKEIYGGDEYIKPSKQSFIRALGPYKIDECIMIGDNYNIDIKPAKELGIKTIMISDKEVADTTVIKKIYELKEML